MVSPDVRCHVRRWSAIASIVAILGGASSAIALPASPTLAYYTPTVNAYELYVRPLWFGRSDANPNEADPALAEDPIDDLQLPEDELPTPSQLPTTEPETPSESRT